MSIKLAVTPLCIFVLALSFLFSASSLRNSNRSSADSLTPQIVPLIINEYLADPAGSASADLTGDANGDGTRDSADDEFIEVVNNGAAPLNVGLFTISDATQVRFTFPAGRVIPPGESAVVFGGGTPTGAFGNAGANGLVFTAGAGGLSLNNGGDTITIKDNLGATVVSVTFGAAEGGANQSITRSPDVTGSFVTHATAPGSNGALFSPGARVNGAPFTTTDPVIASISPEGAIAGSGELTMTVTGLNFQSGSSLRVNGSPVFTSFSSPGELEAQIPSSVTDAAGTYLITVQNPGGAISNAVSFIVLGQIGINEYMADPPDGPTGDANGDGIRDSAQDEFVEIVNRTGSPIDVSGFALRDADAQRFSFPPGTILPAGEAAVVFGGGSPQADFGNARVNGLVFTAPLSLNNSGDTLELRNLSGVTIESITFGAIEGGANQSINRNPDVSGIRFTTHSAVPGGAGRLFSPGTLVNGSAFTIGPRLASIAPDSANKDASPFDMTVKGSGFENSSTVLIDGQPLITVFVDPELLMSRVTSNVTAGTGPHVVHVRNEGGNRSNSLILTIVPPPPILQSISPRIVLVGAGPYSMFLTGLNFAPGAQVLIDGTPIATTFFSSFDLSALVTPSFTATTGVRAVIVRNSDGKQSNSAAFEVVPPATIVTSISPTNVVAGGPSFEMLVAGKNFKTGASVLFDRTDLATTFKSPAELVAQVPASLIAKPGIHSVSVRNSDEAQSNDSVFRVFPESPLIGSLDPSTVIAGSEEVMVTIGGQKFQQGAVVRVIEATNRGAALDTLFLSAERLQARVPSVLTHAPGSVLLAVENPDLGLSNSVTLKVLIKDPLVINEYLASPAEGLAGDANGDGTRSASADEFVEILNRSGEPLDISEYKVLDADSVRHVFAAGTILPPFEAAVVFGGGTPTGSFGNATDNHLVFKASSGGLSLNNGGDTISLHDARGRIVQSITFGTTEGGAGQSINRDPDGDGATFSLHMIVSADGSLFSPGSRAGGQTFTIKPVLSHITPAAIRVGALGVSLTVSGSKFLPGAVVLFGDSPLPTTFRAETQLEAQVPANLVSQGGAADVYVKNPRGELSGSVRLLIVDDPPNVSGVTPNSAGTGAQNLEVEVSGKRFQQGAQVRIQGEPVETRFVSSTSLMATLPGALFGKAAELPLSVLNTDGNISNIAILTVENGPLITRLSRGRIRAGSGVFELTVGGVAFKPGVILFANDTALSTTFVNDSTLTARIPADLTSQPGVLTLQARHPDGGRSNIVKLKVK
ncbi:MAG TPA: lamin tail domain-containing protein [Blastocatellia bacterium]|nr:lamin tail domain-containing protein [Blastocatellia bacterium]